MKRHWIVAVAATVSVMMVAARWSRLQELDPLALPMAMTTFVGWYTLLRADRALREPAVSPVEIGALSIIGGFGWYLTLIAFPTMMIGQGPQFVPSLYAWLMPLALALYAILRRARVKRGASPEW